MAVTNVFNNEVPLFVMSKTVCFTEKRFPNVYRTLDLSKAFSFHGELGAASVALSQCVSGAAILDCQLRGSI